MYEIACNLHVGAIVFMRQGSRIKTKEIPESSREVEMQFVDSLGDVSFSIPCRYDTSFRFADESDCGKPCNKQKYRFQSKASKIIKESGFVKLDRATDSIDRFTIYHSGYLFWHEGTIKGLKMRHPNLKAALFTDPSIPPIVFDTLTSINGRPFSIFLMEKVDSLMEKHVLGVTLIMNNEVWFHYELITSKNDQIAQDFTRNSLRLIHSICIDNPL